MFTISRQQFLKGFAASVVAASTTQFSFAQNPPEVKGVSLDDLKSAAKVAGVKFTEAELKDILKDVNQAITDAGPVRAQVQDPGVAPGTCFRVMSAERAPKGKSKVRPVTRSRRALPAQTEDIAFASVPELNGWLTSGKINSKKLTEIALDRLKMYGPKLRCVINLTPERAMEEAAKADREFKNGRVKSILQGIPYGVKDLFAAKGYPTTWGAEPYKNQAFDYDSAVVEKLGQAGAVLVAKLSMGALAEGDVWFGGRTESPWDPKIGSSGSSAGSGSAVAAGLLPFAIGTETSGSIVSPAHNCRVTGIRPTFGSVSRFGAMPLSWTMDKAGVISRSAEDCALVLGTLLGHDPRDPGSIARTISYPIKANLGQLKIGFAVFKKAKASAPVPVKGNAYLELLVAMGATLKPVFIDPGLDGLGAILAAEAAGSFDSFTRSDKIHDLTNSAWPNYFRAARFNSAVDLVQADRARRLLMEEYETAIGGYDLIVVEDRGYPIIYNLNLTGHPQVLIPFGTDEKGQPRSFSLIGSAFSEGLLLSVAFQIQKKAGYFKRRPDMSIWR